MPEVEGQAWELLSQGTEVRGGSVESGLGVLWHLPGRTLLWGGQRHSIWEHPGHTQQTASLPIPPVAHVPERCRSARGRCGGYWGRGGSPGLPTGQWLWLRLFLRIFWRAFPMGSAVEEGRKPLLNLPMVIVMVPQWGTLTGVSFWWPTT